MTELLVSIAIIGILSAIVVSGQVQQRNISLARRTAEQLVSDLQTMQNSALSGQTLAGSRPAAFGLSVTTTPVSGKYQYTTFGDAILTSTPCSLAASIYNSSPVGVCSPADTLIATTQLDSAMTITRLCTNSTCLTSGSGNVSRLDFAYTIPNATIVIISDTNPATASTITSAAVVVKNIRLNTCYAMNVNSASGTVSQRQLATC